jgi:uncharacterized membrane protein
VSGELWAVHGGGFYHPVKFNVAPKLPDHLHWFYWESYTTWLSGFALFTVSYLWNASTYLVDKSRMDWAPATAIVAALAFLVVFWLLYDAICRASASARTATPSSARWCWCWCASPPGWPATGSPGARPSCWWAR